MKSICYENTITSLPGWIDTVHIEQKFGYAYETPTHYVHFYGQEPFYLISTGLTVTEQKASAPSLSDWALMRFGAKNITPMKNEVRHTIEGVWRPALRFWKDTCDALKIDKQEQIAEEQSIRVLIQQLDNLLLYIEPSPEGLEAYSHKTRELLILACTEVENQWRSSLRRIGVTATNGKDYTTNDYVKLQNRFFLNEFAISLRNTSFSTKVTPFRTWDASHPTASLPWYDAYNKTKHDRSKSFSQSRLRHVIDAISANLVLYATRYSPLALTNNATTFSSIINQMFTISIEQADRASFYLPLLDTTKITNPGCIVFDLYQEKLNLPWIVDPTTTF